MNKFTNPHDPNNENIKTLLEHWIRKNLSLHASANIFIHEQVCSEPSCVFAETLITIEQEESVKNFVIAKPLTFVRERDVATMREVADNNTKRHAH